MKKYGLQIVLDGVHYNSTYLNDIKKDTSKPVVSLFNEMSGGWNNCGNMIKVDTAAIRIMYIDNNPYNLECVPEYCEIPTVTIPVSDLIEFVIGRRAKKENWFKRSVNWLRGLPYIYW